MKSLLVALVGLFPWAARAGAPQVPPPLAEAFGDLDGDGQPERIHLEPDGSLRVDDTGGRELGRAALPAGRPGTITLVSAEEHRLVWARVPVDKSHTAEAVVRVDGGKLETVYQGTTGPMGDGERAERLRVDDAGVVRYQTAPTVARCDGADMLFPERWDFDGHRFRPVESEVPEGKLLSMSQKPPAGLLPQPLGLFHFTAASTSPDAERRADRLGAPRELEDGKLESAWVAGPAGGGRGAWVTARAPAGGQRLRALHIVGGPGAPEKLTLIVGKELFSLALRGGEWAILPEAMATGCLSLVVAEPHKKGADTSLAEVTIYTDLDVAGGLEQLIEVVANDAPNAAGAEQVLGQRGAEAARAIGTRLASGGELQGRRRLLDALASLKVPEAAAPLGKALESARGPERPVVVDGLIKLGAAGAVEARRVIADGSQAPEARADAAKVLGAVAGEDDVKALIAAAAATEPMVRVATLRSLVAASGRDASVRERVAAALAAPPISDGCGVEVGILARVAVGTPGVEQAFRRCGDKGEFTLKLRLVRSLRNAELLQIAARDGEPMIRAAAVESGAKADALINDADPGVRRAALGALDKSESAPVESALSSDRWPLVRRAAAEALGRRCGDSAKNALGHSLQRDAAEEVRRESLVAMAHCGPIPMTLLGGVLASADQPMAVRELAAALVAKQGGPEAGRLLAQAIVDGLSDPSADERSALLVVACLRGLGRLKDSSKPVLEALGAASNEPVSGAVRASAMEAIGRICPEGAGEALARGRGDPDPMVRRAAQQALDNCHR